METTHKCPLCNCLCTCGATNPNEHLTPHPSMRHMDEYSRRQFFKERYPKKAATVCVHKCPPGYGENHWACDDRNKQPTETKSEYEKRY